MKPQVSSGGWHDQQIAGREIVIIQVAPNPIAMLQWEEDEDKRDPVRGMRKHRVNCYALKTQNGGLGV